jgi:hypothetical protein
MVVISNGFSKFHLAAAAASRKCAKTKLGLPKRGCFSHDEVRA